MRDYGGLTPEEIQAIIREGKRIEEERQKRKSRLLPDESPQQSPPGFHTDDSEHQSIPDNEGDIYTDDQRMLDEDIAIDEGDNPFDRIPG